MEHIINQKKKNPNLVIKCGYSHKINKTFLISLFYNTLL